MQSFPHFISPHARMLAVGAKSSLRGFSMGMVPSLLPSHFVAPAQGTFSGRIYQSLEVAFLCRGKGLNWLARKISENP
jgi:hypothetical protein